MRITLFLLLCTINGYCLYGQSKLNRNDLEQVFGYMSGSFNSEIQSKNDSAFYNISLHMKPIKPLSKEGYYLYVEQAVTTLLDKPYRQRVYHIYLLNDTTIISQVYELKNPKAYIGAWKEKIPLKNITLDSLEIRTGCAIYLKKNHDGFYSGATPGNECVSSLRGAAYATSEVSIYPNRIISWDRGWNNEGKQVWGAVKGGYDFIKIENYKLK